MLMNEIKDLNKWRDIGRQQSKSVKSPQINRQL